MARSYSDTKGVVFNIQHYCVHDGPGIRTNVFLQGCPLRCVWCANPESQAFTPQLLFRKHACKSCGACVTVCPVNAIVPTDDGFVATDREKCLVCGACAAVCPPKARSVSGKTMTAGEVAADVLKDSLFYGEEGGVTLTGGEATAQPAFAQAVLCLCKEAGITTCMETCGAVNTETLLDLAQHTDTFLFDVKAVDAEKHKAFTGADNGPILQNLKALNDRTACDIIVRTPIVPGCNDADADVEALGAFLKENVPRCREAHLLPYHNLGVDKNNWLEREGEPFEAAIPDDAEMERLRDILRRFVETVK